MSYYKMHKYVIVIGLVLLAGVVFFAYNYRNEKVKESMENLEEIKKENIIVKKENVEVLLNKKPELPGYDENEIVQANVHENPGQFLLDDGMNREGATIGNLCSLNCCSDDWNKPKINDGVDDPEKYVKTNLYCRNGIQSSGCMCVTKTQKKHMMTRVGNSD